MARINTTKMLSNDGYFSSNDYNPFLNLMVTSSRLGGCVFVFSSSLSS